MLCLCSLSALPSDILYLFLSAFPVVGLLHFVRCPSPMECMQIIDSAIFEYAFVMNMNVRNVMNFCIKCYTVDPFCVCVSVRERECVTCVQQECVCVQVHVCVCERERERELQGLNSVILLGLKLQTVACLFLHNTQGS